MSESQEAIYYLSSEELEIPRSSPHLEGFASRGVEVLLLTEPVDEIRVQALGSYNEKPLRSITKGAVDLDGAFDGEDAPSTPPPSPEVEQLLQALKESLGDEVKDVRVSGRLTDSAVCLVADEMDLDVRLARLLSEHGQVPAIPPRILEVNAEHSLIRKLAEKVAGGAADVVGDVAHLLLDQARIAEGETVPDPAEFSSRLVEVLQRSLGD